MQCLSVAYPEPSRGGRLAHPEDEGEEEAEENITRKWGKMFMILRTCELEAGYGPVASFHV